MSHTFYIPTAQHAKLAKYGWYRDEAPVTVFEGWVEGFAHWMEIRLSLLASQEEEKRQQTEKHPLVEKHREEAHQDVQEEKDAQ